ncbi:damage-inducible protein CinA [Marinicauda salina]|uniref:Damage-inducible protein CinA n=1 Tax=Marinicauda salina TaxID=2135793 RepID=A0A2U2BT88_9PROT|nr:nicotinamide-nucleotide amidohydrolase family protein [Marinicauda salina]PWE17200.1 damage-inducible protein CinA [Marinicauda salina]
MSARFSPVRVRARALVEAATARGVMLATAESCTGGLVGAALTEIAGSSAVFERGFVTYSNAAKTEMLGVPAGTIERCGAVSRETAAAMASGALARSRAQIAVSITGIAGPGGGAPGKPVGLVWFGLAATRGANLTVARCFGDVGRERVRELSVLEALRLLSAGVERF